MAQWNVFGLQYRVAEFAVLVIDLFQLALRGFFRFFRGERFGVAVPLFAFETLDLFLVALR